MFGYGFLQMVGFNGLLWRSLLFRSRQAFSLHTFVLVVFVALGLVTEDVSLMYVFRLNPVRKSACFLLLDGSSLWSCGSSKHCICVLVLHCSYVRELSSSFPPIWWARIIFSSCLFLVHSCSVYSWSWFSLTTTFVFSCCY